MKALKLGGEMQEASDMLLETLFMGVLPRGSA